MIFATVWALFLPNVRYSKYFHAEEQVVVTAGAATDEPRPEAFSKKAIHDPDIPKYTAEKDDRLQNVSVPIRRTRFPNSTRLPLQTNFINIFILFYLRGICLALFAKFIRNRFSHQKRGKPALDIYFSRNPPYRVIFARYLYDGGAGETYVVPAYILIPNAIRITNSITKIRLITRFVATSATI